MSIEGIQNVARDKNISFEEALQVFLQVLVLKHLSLPGVHCMGGTALVMGYANPRFSEDVDLTQVQNPMDLSSGLKRAAKEASAWLKMKVVLTEPKLGNRTWKMTCAIDPAHTVRLHIDSQPFQAVTTRPIVIEFPGLTSFVCEALTLQEILSEKILALAFRNYLAGRDLFDLWFHWLRKSDGQRDAKKIRQMIQFKLKERKLDPIQFQKKLENRIFKSTDLKRARQEWKRYLPREFQKESIFKDILECHHKLKTWIFDGAG